MTLSAVLLDVGGTLWPRRATSPEADDADRLPRLHAVLPDATTAVCLALLREFKERVERAADDAAQNTDGMIAAAALALGLPLDAQRVTAVRRALCLPAEGRVTLFDGARELLTASKAAGLRCVVVSDTDVRDGDAYLEDFKAFGLSGCVDAAITSLDVGFRKPHRAMFAAALGAAGCTAAECVMIGDREARDIIPAVALGMRAVLVAIEESQPAVTAAHAVTASLYEVAALVNAWARAG